MTMGFPAGSRLIIDGREEFILVAPTRWVSEPTGAGDAYRAGLMRGMQLACRGAWPGAWARWPPPCAGAIRPAKSLFHARGVRRALSRIV